MFDELTDAQKNSDLGNAELLYSQCAHLLRYVSTWKQWYAWDDNEGFWAPDVKNMVATLAARVIIVETATAGLAAEKRKEVWTKAIIAAEFNKQDPNVKACALHLKAAESRYKWLCRSQNHERLRALVTVAAQIPDWIVTFEELDTHPMLLACANGTVDLITGKLRPSLRSDLITKRTPFNFDPAATCPVWDAFIAKSMGGNPALIAYLQRIAGYCITGRIDEEILGFFFGGGANGKTTFLVALKAIMGDYACQGPRGLLFWSKNERHPTEFAKLFKMRFVVCSEVDEGARLDEGRVKDLTGGDAVSARRMREDFWEFKPTHKLCIAGNHWFFVRGTDEGIWRRIRVVPWMVQIPSQERDHKLSDKLAAEAPGILAWAVRGALAWQEQGLEEPSEVLAATKAFREESDPVSRFLKEEVILDPESRISADRLHALYRQWCGVEEIDALATRKFAKALRSNNIESTTVKENGVVKRGWRGIRTCTAEERASLRWGKEKTDV